MPRNPPAGTHDYVYAGKIEQMEASAIEKADQAATPEISNPIVRDIIPDLDFDAGADVSAVNGFDVSPTSDGPGEYEVFEIDSDTGKADDRVFAIYGFQIVQGGEYVDGVNFESSDGQTFERARLVGLDESGDTEVEQQKVLRSPIAFEPQENGSVILDVGSGYASSGDTIELKLLGVTAEKTGRRVGTRQ